jgi:aminopeptidase N
VDWYPFIPPYVAGQGWLAHTPGYYGEHLAYDTADFSVNLKLVDPNANLVVAASAPERRDGEWRRYQHSNARNFALSISPYYQVVSNTVGGVTITSYAFPAQEAANQAVLQTTSQALELYSRLLAPYPHPHLSVVEADFLDGMEYDGLYFLSKGFYNLYAGTPDAYLVSIAAHETTHQWWYGLVGNDQALEPWLDEALCTYSEAIYYENYYPEALKWWWDYRVNYYQPHGWVDDSIYNPHGEAQAYRAYRDAVYLNGARFLDDLRKLVGDQAFFAFLKDYLTKNTGQITSADEFFSILQEHTRADIQPLLDTYFFNR